MEKYFKISKPGAAEKFAAYIGKDLGADYYSNNLFLELLKSQISLGLTSLNRGMRFSISNGDPANIIKPLRQLFVYCTLLRIKSRLKCTEPVLADVGCGRCFYKPYIQKIGIKYTGYDMQESKDLDADSSTNEFIDCDITSFYFKPISSDIILCTEVLEHVPEPVRLLRTMCNQLNPNGTLVLTIPYFCKPHQEPYYYYNGFHPNLINYLIESSAVKLKQESRIEIKITDDLIFQGFCIQRV